MRRHLISLGLVLALTGVAAAATTTAEITPDKFGTLVLQESTIDDAKTLFGEPTQFKRLGEGCWDKMRRLKWGTGLTIFFYLSRGEQRVLQPVVKQRLLDLANGDQWRVETGRGLTIGDSKKRLLELYPKAKNYGSRTYTLLVKDGYKYQTATLDADDRVKKLSAAISC